MVVLPRFRSLRKVEPLGLPSAMISAPAGIALFFRAALGDIGTFMPLLIFPFVASREGVVEEGGKLLPLLPPKLFPGLVPAENWVDRAPALSTATAPEDGNERGNAEKKVRLRTQSRIITPNHGRLHQQNWIFGVNILQDRTYYICHQIAKLQPLFHLNLHLLSDANIERVQLEFLLCFLKIGCHILHRGPTPLLLLEGSCPLSFHSLHCGCGLLKSVAARAKDLPRYPNYFLFCGA
mmetsp:Transcript_2239/g.5512  ORF Transcript_2239/g.5512 Transcript_2239/m.5512 type:complete len:237 (+) Transcript_2239:1337-2047(+)